MGHRRAAQAEATRAALVDAARRHGLELAAERALTVVHPFNDPAVKEAMVKQGNTINIQSPEASAAFFQSELNKYASIVKKAGIKPD